MMASVLKGKWSWIVLFSLLFSFVLLTGCSETLEVTPTRPATTASVATATPAVTVATPAFTPTPAVVIAEPPRPPVSHPENIAAKSTPVARPEFEEFRYANSEYFVHLPPRLPEGQALQVVIAVHGMGNNGLAFGQPLVEYSDRYNLVLVAPTMRYDTNYQDPGVIASNDSQLLPELHSLIKDLPDQLHFPVKSKVLLFGFSRGGQIVHRYAMFYPEEVLGVAAMSAGNYTLPQREFQSSASASTVSLKFPYGVADISKYSGNNLDVEALRQVSFWLGVGGADNAIKDVPAAWSPYLGQTRIERAAHFYQALKNAGVDATLTVFPGVGHAVCTEMKQQAFAFFNRLLE